MSPYDFLSEYPLKIDLTQSFAVGRMVFDKGFFLPQIGCIKHLGNTLLKSHITVTCYIHYLLTNPQAKMYFWQYDRLRIQKISSQYVTPPNTR